jgi:WD40 repeat protein
VALLLQGRLTRPIVGSAVTISPDKKYIIMIFGSYRTIQLCTIETDRPELPLELNSKSLGGHRGFVRSVSFSPDGKYIASSSSDHTIRIYHNNVANRTCHNLQVRAIAPRGKYESLSKLKKIVTVFTVVPFRFTKIYVFFNTDSSYAA